MPTPIFTTFEAHLHPSQQPRAEAFYATLAPLVTIQPGFISETPFVSVDRQGAQLLYVRFESEETLRAWRRDKVHLRIQREGREGVLVDYRVRVGREVESGAEEEEEGEEGKRGRYLVIWQYPGRWDEGGVASKGEGPKCVGAGVWQGLVDAATYHNETHVLRITTWSSLEVARAVKESTRRIGGDDLRLIRVERDYGRFQRGEAPEDADRCQAAAGEGDQDALTE